MLITKTVQINASPELLWELLVDIDQLKKWTPSLVSEEPISPGPPQVGSLSKMKIKEGSKIVEYESEITTHQPTNHLGIVLRGGNLGDGPMNVDYYLRAEETGTVVRYEARWEPHGLWLKLMSPIITKMAQRNASETMNQLKALAEEMAKEKPTAATNEAADSSFRPQ